MSRTQVLSWGGGRQTTAMLVLITQGKLPRPDRIVIADTGREKSSTWDYMDEVAQPLAQSVGLTIETAPHSLATVDLYSHLGELLLPAYTITGKLSAFCSTEWKARVVQRYLSGSGVERATNWIGFAWDERKRIKTPKDETPTSKWNRSYPLCDLLLTKADCRTIILDAGLPMPPPSACWMCPNMSNTEWRGVREYSPVDFEQACQIDEEIRAEDIEQGHGGVWLHHSRVPLREADLDADDGRLEQRQCGLGLCHV